MATRRIIHIDMDAFYAAIEQREHPQWIGRPVVVGGDPHSRGVVATCSYEARKYGIHSAMSSAQALARCAQAVFVKPRFTLYREVSVQIFRILGRYTELLEPVSLDEAYLDLSDVDRGRTATDIARAIKREIRAAIGLTASAGVSYNKFLAKIASDLNKPDGLYTIPPHMGADFVASLPVRKFHGIGKATEQKMKVLGINTGADLRHLSLQRLSEIFGKVGNYYYHAARGMDERRVRPNRERKSVGSEITFAEDLHNPADMLRQLRGRATKVAEILAARRLTGHTVTVKVKFADFTQVTRACTLMHALSGCREMCSLLPGLLAKTDATHRPVRLLGVTVSNLRPSAAARQLDLWRTAPPRMHIGAP